MVAESGWFAARPSGTEDIYKIYAESFASAEHLQRHPEGSAGGRRPGDRGAVTGEAPDMDTRTLDDTARSLLSGERGLLAMDESTPTCDRRFAALGIAQTAEMRRAYRDMIVTTPGLGESIGGAILYDETIRQQTNAGVPFAAGAAAGRHRAGHQGRRRQQAARRLPRRRGDRRPRRSARPPCRIRRHGRALREVARRDPHRRRHADATAACSPTRTRSPATPRSARKRASCRSSSPRC